MVEPESMLLYLSAITAFPEILAASYCLENATVVGEAQLMRPAGVLTFIELMTDLVLDSYQL